MEVLMCWLSSVPNVIWSAIIASCLTFFGVFLTNRGNEKRQTLLLEYEKEKFQAEQKLALKKEVFLSMASSFADVLSVVPKLMNLDITQKDIDSKLEDHSGKVAKSYLVAKEESVAKILNYSADTAESLLGLVTDRAVLLDHKEAISIYQGTIDSANNEKNRILAMMKEFNLQGRNDQATFDYLNKSYEVQDEIAEKNQESLNEQSNTLKELHLKFMKRCIKEHGLLLSKLPNMTIALRNELDNNDNSAIFIEALDANIERMNAAFDGLFKENEA